MPLAQSGRDDQLRHITAERLLRRIAEGHLRGMVERQHSAARVDGDDCVEGRGQHRLEERRESLLSGWLRQGVTTYAVTADFSTPSAVVAEDQPLLRDGIASLLELNGFRVVGRCENATDLLVKVRSYTPDVAVVDIRMPPTYRDEGLQAAAEIRADHPDTGVLVLSQHIEPEHAARLVASDASGIGYLLKERVRDGDDFIDAVRRVASGGTAFDPQVIAALVAGKGHTATERLSERELQVLSLMAEGLSNAAIGGRLYLSPRAVERDISTIFTKLDLTATDIHNRRVLAVLSFLGVRPPQ